MGELRKEITLWTGIGQLSTTLLGTGLFMIPAIAAGIADRDSLWAWLILFVLVIPIALTFAALGKRYPSAGGTAYFVRQAFGTKLERSVGWLFLTVTPVAIPAGVALSASFAKPLLPTPFNQTLIIELLTIALLVMVNLTGSKSSARIQTFIALSICLLIGLFWLHGDINRNDFVMPTLSFDAIIPIGSALAVMFWCFVGIEAFAHMGAEFKNPEKDFPIAIIIGCLLGGLVYWACSVVILKYNAFGSNELASGSIPFISQKIFGTKAVILVSLIGYFACFASMNLYMQSLSRMAFALAKNNRPDSAMASVSRRGVPAMATLSVASVIAISTLFKELFSIELADLVRLSNGVFILVYLLAMLSACKLLRGWNRQLAIVALFITISIFFCLGWASIYAIIMLIITQVSIHLITYKIVDT